MGPLAPPGVEPELEKALEEGEVTTLVTRENFIGGAAKDLNRSLASRKERPPPPAPPGPQDGTDVHSELVLEVDEHLVQEGLEQVET